MRRREARDIKTIDPLGIRYKAESCYPRAESTRHKRSNAATEDDSMVPRGDDQPTQSVEGRQLRRRPRLQYDTRAPVGVMSVA